MSELYSAFSSYIEGFLEAREALGYKNIYYRPALTDFDRYCRENYADADELSEEIVISWIMHGTEKVNSTTVNRASVMRLFATYLNSREINAYVIPTQYFTQTVKSLPYVMSDQELKAFFDAIDSLPPSSKVKYSDIILPVIFRLIYTCGLRPGEGIKLKRRNVNLNSGEILIAHTKKKKERFVVMSDDMLGFCRNYEKCRQFFYEDNEFFFPGNETDPVDSVWLGQQFKKAWENANPDISKELLPAVRIYDLRHRFASAVMNRWLDEGKDLYAFLPRLSAYMGHKGFGETAYYIHVLPENLTKSPGVDWNALSEVFPEVPSWEG